MSSDTVRPTGARVARRISEVRKEQRLTLQDLSNGLKDLGHPVIVSGLSKIENADRRIDVDDLIAISVVLGVSPLELLLPNDGATDEYVQLVGELESGRRLLAEVRAAWAPRLRSRRPGPASLSHEVDALVDGIAGLLESVQALRQDGFDISVPARLLHACQRVVDEGGNQLPDAPSDVLPAS